MKAIAFKKKGVLEWIELNKPKLLEGKALLKMKAVALNRRDEWIKQGKYPNIKNEVILGSDGAGVVDAVGSKSDKSWVGKEVVINPNVNWGEDPEIQSKYYSILGMPENGTFAEYCMFDIDRIQPKPNHLDVLQAAAIPLGGLTAYRALFRHGGASKGQNILISGFGGGVAQFAFLFAKAVGANVYITTGSNDKVNRALKMGAKGAFNYNSDDTSKDLWKTKGGFDLVIDSAGGEQINSFIKLLRPKGKIVFYGATNGLPSTIDLYRMFWNQLTLQGSTMGNDNEFIEMLSFISKHKISPIVDSLKPFSNFLTSINDLSLPNKIGKIVFKM